MPEADAAVDPLCAAGGCSEALPCALAASGGRSYLCDLYGNLCGDKRRRYSALGELVGADGYRSTFAGRRSGGVAEAERVKKGVAREAIEAHFS